MTMDCLQFRRAVGADPQHLEPEARAHAAECPQCAGYLRDMLELDTRVLAALRVPVSGPAGGAGETARQRGLAGVPGFDRRRLLALAASIVAGVLIGTLLWVGQPRESLAQDLVEHLGHEPQALVATGPADRDVVARVLERGGIRLRPDGELVSYANSCPFRGHVVPHLVVQTDAGPVTVMVLRNEKTDAPVSFDEQGYAGRIVPAGPGSIAVIGAAGADLEQVAARVLDAVEWLND